MVRRQNHDQASKIYLFESFGSTRTSYQPSRFAPRKNGGAIPPLNAKREETSGRDLLINPYISSAR